MQSLQVNRVIDDNNNELLFEYGNEYASQKDFICTQSIQSIATFHRKNRNKIPTEPCMGTKAYRVSQLEDKCTRVQATFMKVSLITAGEELVIRPGLNAIIFPVQTLSIFVRRKQHRCCLRARCTQVPLCVEPCATCLREMSSHCQCTTISPPDSLGPAEARGFPHLRLLDLRRRTSTMTSSRHATRFHSKSALPKWIISSVQTPSRQPVTAIGK